MTTLVHPIVINKIEKQIKSEIRVKVTREHNIGLTILKAENPIIFLTMISIKKACLRFNKKIKSKNSINKTENTREPLI